MLKHIHRTRGAGCLAAFSLVAVLCLVPLRVQAQTAGQQERTSWSRLTDGPTQVWADAGLGMGQAVGGLHTQSGGSLGGRLGVQVRSGHLAITARTTATSGGTCRSRGCEGILGPKRDELLDAGLLVGVVLPIGSGFEVAAAGGVARVWGSRIESSGTSWSPLGGSGKLEPFEPRLGLPLEAALSTRLSRRFRLGLTVYGNVNTEGSFTGAVVTLSGRVW